MINAFFGKRSLGRHQHVRSYHVFFVGVSHLLIAVADTDLAAQHSSWDSDTEAKSVRCCLRALAPAKAVEILKKLSASGFCVLQVARCRRNRPCPVSSDCMVPHTAVVSIIARPHVKSCPIYSTAAVFASCARELDALLHRLRTKYCPMLQH